MRNCRDEGQLRSTRMHVRRDGVRVQSGREQVMPRLEACQPLAETFGVHQDLLVWRTRGVLRA